MVNHIVGWRAGLDDPLARFAHRFGRAEPRKQALSYLVGLLSPLAAKNDWTLEAYGLDSKFRTWLQQQQVGYVLAVPRNQRIPTTAGNWRPDLLANAAPVEAWRRRSCGDGAKGPRLYDWATATLPDTDVDGYRQWLLIRRSSTNPDDRAYYLCFGPAGTDDETLTRVAGARWAIEECFQSAKTEVGLDQHQVRRYDAWYRHITSQPRPAGAHSSVRSPTHRPPGSSRHESSTTRTGRQLPSRTRSGHQTAGLTVCDPPARGLPSALPGNVYRLGDGEAGTGWMGRTSDGAGGVVAELVKIRRLTDQKDQQLQRTVRRGSTNTVRYRRSMMLLTSAGATEFQ
ncbi:hypothetical protein [Plantactinospora sp. BC1]|uniref:IS701 family transposase n=1 Tax=Plantactinospora sp. BC1 TaxID=2108470 RepID=UPI001F2318FC|nr:hypothetical protein [Plantactinospora sp. BC1]